MWQALALQAGASIISGIGQAKVQESEQKIAEMNARVQAKAAEMQGNLAGLRLSQEYNKQAGQNAVIAAAQGRRGGSVQAMSMAAKSELDWDKEFLALSTQIQVSGYQSQAEQHALAAKAAKSSIYSTLAGATIDAATSAYTIGGSDKSKSLLSSTKDDGTLYEGGASGWY